MHRETAGCFRTDIVIAGRSTLVDATELGDIARMCGVAYDIGMESRSLTHEDMMLSYGRMPGGKYMLNWPIEGNFLGKRKKQDTLIAIIVDVSQRVTER